MAAYSRARRISSLLATPSPSSVNITTPALTSSPISVSSAPRRPLVMAADGSTLTMPSALALDLTSSMMATLSMAGMVLGMATSVVTPPAAAARVPLAMVSLPSWPGSRKCTCKSTRPGMSQRPFASNIVAGPEPVEGAPVAWSAAEPTAATLPSSIRTEVTVSTPAAGSINRALMIRVFMASPPSFPASRYKTAMRTATPLATCSVMALCGPSATPLLISTPRFIGPGCMTVTSGLHQASFSEVRL